MDGNRQVDVLPAQTEENKYLLITEDEKVTFLTEAGTSLDTETVASSFRAGANYNSDSGASFQSLSSSLE